MVYNPATDFLGLWRNALGVVSKVEMPGLDYVVAALARAGIVTLSVSAAAPVVNQSTTAWLQAAVPSYSAEGALFLWDKVTDTYEAATPALFLQLLEASAGESGVSWWTTAGGPPINTVGNDGDYAIQTDNPGGIYGPKAAGAWPADPLPGTTNEIESTALDNSFGTVQGTIIQRGPLVWQGLEQPTTGIHELLVSDGAGGLLDWEGVSALLDIVFGTVTGSILMRGFTVWLSIPPGDAGTVLGANGPGATIGWTPRTAEFPSGTVMLFQQTAAPTGWTKQTLLNDYGLRVTSGSVSSVSGSAFSTVFAQTTVGNHTLSTAEMPSHSHTYAGATNTTTAVAAAGHSFADAVGGNTGSTGGDGAHNHSINLTLSYVDVIIASKN